MGVSLPSALGDAVPALWQVNESWTLENCTVAKCEGDNHIVVLEPKPVAQVTCVNGHVPVKVQSPQDPCQYHYECECERSGRGRWGARAGTQRRPAMLAGPGASQWDSRGV